METLPIILWLGATAFMARSAFGRGADDPAWEGRWRGLDSATRARIVRAVDLRAAIDALAPDERELTPGFRRYQRRRRAYVALVPAALLCAAGALTMAGVMGMRPFDWGVAAFAIATTASDFLRKRWIRRTLRAGTPVGP